MGEFENRLARLQDLNGDAFQALLFKNDDRATVIMATGLLEDLLALSIVHRFRRHPTENQANELFIGYGPLASLSSKTILGYLIGILPTDAKHDFTIIRKMRNDFAHIFEPLTFDSKAIASRCNSLKLTGKLTEKAESLVGTGPKAKFIRSTVRLFSMLVMSVYVSTEEKTTLQEHRSKTTERARLSYEKGREKAPPSS
jgi:hypothetical protein